MISVCADERRKDGASGSGLSYLRSRLGISLLLLFLLLHYRVFSFLLADCRIHRSWGSELAHIRRVGCNSPVGLSPRRCTDDLEANAGITVIRNLRQIQRFVLFITPCRLLTGSQASFTIRSPAVTRAERARSQSPK